MVPVSVRFKRNQHQWDREFALPEDRVPPCTYTLTVMLVTEGAHEVTEHRPYLVGQGSCAIGSALQCLPVNSTTRPATT